MLEIRRHNGGFVISGHAGYAERGQDIVCAAVSALVQTFIASIEELTKDHITSDIRAGKAVICYRNLSESARLLLDSFFVGVRMIAEDYPANVRIVQGGTMLNCQDKKQAKVSKIRG
ncbi:MAG: ribosomal-processing cysteine protease Prp [Oscillospiraceae bacterium]|nr:ribosomal-processing cysteine protease Prp [Oscillospiraceae bacterium]MDD3261391.1 ribosomal-processing cysteine protease Prp [Oscillospiraceae bacterium]